MNINFISKKHDPYYFTVKQNLSYIKRLINSKAFETFFTAVNHLSLSNEQSKRAGKLKRHYQIRARRTIEGKKVFGKYLIHFGANVEAASTIGSTPSKIKLKQVTNKARKAAKEINLAHPNKLKAEKKKTEGICFAASMHCIHRILDRADLDEKAAFIEATSIYKNGVPEKIAIAQTLSKQLHPSSKTDYYKKKMKLADSFFTKYFNFHLGHHYFCPKKDFAKSFLKEATSGTYLMNIMDDKWKAGHSMVIVKNMNGSVFIYDPNFGSAIVPKKDAQQILERVFNHSYYTGLDNLVYAKARAN